MSRTFPNIARVAVIRDSLATHLERTFTLTALARALRLGRAICHGC